MPALLLAESPADSAGDEDPIWPETKSHAAAWACDLHDALDGDRPRNDADVIARIASWLRVQVVGRDTVCVVEPRMSAYQYEWNAAAAAAGLSPVGLLRADGSTTSLPPPPEPTSVPSDLRRPIPVAGGWRARWELWVADRGEALARAAIRAIQR